MGTSEIRPKLTAEEFMAELERHKGNSDKKWIPPYGNTEGRLMLILSYPSSDACIAGDLTEGPHFEEIKNALAVAEIPEDEVYLTTMVKYGIGNNSKPTTAQIEECHALLDFEIKEVNPQLIITLGAEPFKRIIQANKKVTDSLGEIVDSPYGKLLPNYSPGMIFGQDPKLRPFFREVFDLAKRYLEGQLNYTPYEYIVVDDPEVNKVIVQTYLDEGKLMIGYDAEWLGEKFTDDEVMYTFQYSCEPHKAIILDISKDGLTENQALLDTMAPLLCHPEAKRMGWNIRADDKRLAVRGLRPPDSTLWFDGMKACAFFDSRWSKGLETGIRKFTNYEPYYNAFNRALEVNKVKKHDMSKLKLLPETQAVFYHYCGGDAVAHREACINMRARLEAELTPAQQKYFFDVYLPLTHYFLDLELTGLPIDQTVMEDVTLKYKTKYDELKAQVLELIRPYGFDDALLGDMDPKEAAKKGIYPTFNPNSAPQKKILLFDVLGLTPAYYTKSGKSPKPKVWYQKQKPQTQRLYSPSTNGKSLATIKFELSKELETSDDAELKKKHEIVSLLLSLTRVGVFSEKFFCKQGTDFVNDAVEAEYDEDDEPKKSSYWAALCEDGRIHSDFFECLNNFRSSSRVNVQNPASKVLSHIPDIFVPGHGALSKDEQKKVAHLIPRNIRHIFYAGDPDWYWTEVDVAGADLAIAAFCSKDPNYIHDILKGNFHLKKAREYFKDDNISKDDYSKYVSAKAITFRVAYTAELQSAAIPIQAEIYAESGIFIELPLIEYALSTWERYTQYMAFREDCKRQVKEEQCISNARGFKYRFEESENFGITAGWQNESLAYPIASELALFLWDVSVKIKERMVKEGLWMHKIKPVNSVHDAAYWLVHKDLMQDNYFPEICRLFFTKKCTITTGNNLGMEMVVSDRWKGKEVVFHNETEWNFETRNWQWKAKK